MYGIGINNYCCPKNNIIRSKSPPPIPNNNTNNISIDESVSRWKNHPHAMIFDQDQNDDEKMKTKTNKKPLIPPHVPDTQKRHTSN